MKKTSLTLPFILVTLTLGLYLDGAAQQGERTKKPPATISSEMPLEQLEQRLKESVALDFRQWYVRRTYVRLKRKGGCDISFQVSQVPGNPYFHDPQKPGPDLSTAEWSVNLSDLDPVGVEIGRPTKGDYRVIRFAALGGREAIKWRGPGAGEVGRRSEGRFDVGEKVAPQIAAALTQAIIACRE
ncbi:MAG TPA: hypothetical protein VMZ30_07210 [Pyrinomonadaceae bacterium]|nr:hypothetical protein [Pyrinomonadaceae bacterium]